MTTKILAICAAGSMAAAVSGCAGGGKAYDISSIFPADPGKCARYGGDSQGSGITASCMVTKAGCERAAADWRTAMATGGVSDAIEFSCK